MEAIRGRLLDTRRRLKEITAYFLRAGALGFGGPLALIAAFQRDLVEREKWIEQKEFARALALIKALPGPTATQLAIRLGAIRGGKIGGLVAGVCLITPSFFMMVLLGSFYGSFAAAPETKTVLFGVQCAAFGVIAESALRLARPYQKSLRFWIMAILSAAVTLWRPSLEPLVILGAGLFGAFGISLLSRQTLKVVIPAAAFANPGMALTTEVSTISSLPILTKLFAICLKAGTLVFGTGLAIVPLLAHDVVDTHHWLTQPQFMDALAFGQVTPGPVLISASFIGYRVAGLLGALVATLGVFGPAFFNMLTWFPLAERAVGDSPRTRSFVEFAVAAVIGAILVSLTRLGASLYAANPGFSGILIAFAALSLCLLSKLPVWLVIPAGGLAALILNSF